MSERRRLLESGIERVQEQAKAQEMYQGAIEKLDPEMDPEGTKAVLLTVGLITEQLNTLIHLQLLALTAELGTDE